MAISGTTRHISKKKQAAFLKELRSATSLKTSVEREVIAPAYKAIISEYFYAGEWDFDGGTDGYFVDDGLFMSLRLLMEAKYNKDLRNIKDRAEIVIQCIYYMKSFQRTGHDQPNVIFGADQDQMFAVYVPPLIHYLDRDYDWDIAPSSAYRANPDLLQELIEDRTLATFVFDINDAEFDINDVMYAIDRLAQNDGEYDKIKVIPQNIRAVFDSFLTMLNAKMKTGEERAAYVSLFISSLLGGATAPRVDPAKKNTIHLNSGKTFTGIDTIAYSAFFSRYETIYTEAEIATITATYDVLLEELERRRSGDFWTPTIWTDQAHQALNETFGYDWREKYTVWDNCCGTKNLTRDYEFSSLFLSTVFEHELDSATRYNPEAVETFQYDFLNDDISIGPNALFGQDWKMPPKLYRALVENKPLLFLLNPPYATATNQGETSKAGVAGTTIRDQMEKSKYKAATQQLYTQFLYRIMKLKKDFGLTNVAIGLFSPKRFMTGTNSWERFMDDFQEHFTYQRGFYFNAAEFADVKSNWGISFTVWATRNKADKNKNDFPLTLMQSTPSGVQTIGQHTVYNLPQKDLLGEWMKEKIDPHEPKKPEPQLKLKGAVKPYDAKGAPSGRLTESAIGYLHNNGNSVEHSPTYVGMYSAAFGSGHGSPVTPESFERACIVLCVRKALIPAAQDMWVTGHDNYHRPFNAPAEDSAQWREFVADCVVASLFHRVGSNQSALRKVNYNGHVHDLLNEFFFMSYQDMKDLADKHGNRAVKIDANSHSGERFVYRWLEEHKQDFSDEAQNMLNTGRELVQASFPYRENSEVSEKEHLNAWDAGYRQVYNLAENDAPHLLKPCQEAFEILQQKIAQSAEEFNFLG